MRRRELTLSALQTKTHNHAAGLHDTDVLVIGGGPAGSTAATLLRERGHRVTLLEKDHHPRFHIGESLLPANLELFERLGVADEVRAIGMPKWGAEFVSPWHGRGENYLFADSWGCRQGHAYQVRRSEFDHILLRRSAAVGAQVIEDCRVERVEFLDAGGGVRVHGRHQDGRAQTWHARFVVDASGRDTLLASQLGLKARNRRHNSAAIYAHFSGAVRAADKRAGDITIFWFDHGWFWFIPLADGATSIGAVVWPYYLKRRQGNLQDFFLATIAECPALAARLAGAQLCSPVEATGNYSYAARRSHGENYVLLGDAYAFIDPVFSSGVWLAMQSAVAGTAAADTCLREPQRARSALRRFDRVMRHGPRTFSWFIYRINNPIMRDLFMNPSNMLRMKEAILSVLAGDIYAQTPIWRSLRLFKGVYVLISLLSWRRSLRAARIRRHNIRLEPLEHPAARG